MESGKYYVLSIGNNLTESMSKEQILSAITQAIETGTISDVDTGFVEKIKEQNSAANLKFWVGSTAEYNALPTKENGCFYLLTDDTTYEDMESNIEDLQSDVETLQENTIPIDLPNTLLAQNKNYGATFQIEKSILNKYHVFIAYIGTDASSTANDVEVFCYRSNGNIVGCRAQRRIIDQVGSVEKRGLQTHEVTIIVTSADDQYYNCLYQGERYLDYFYEENHLYAACILKGLVGVI